MPEILCEHKLSNEVMRLCGNGDVYIRGKLLTEEDIEKILVTLKVNKEKDNA